MGDLTIESMTFFTTQYSCTLHMKTVTWQCDYYWLPVFFSFKIQARKRAKKGLMSTVGRFVPIENLCEQSLDKALLSTFS